MWKYQMKIRGKKLSHGRLQKTPVNDSISNNPDFEVVLLKKTIDV